MPLGHDDASILHADLDSFFSSVEQRDHFALRGKPVGVGGGVILAASYEAKAVGVKTAMNIATAKRLCPELIIVEPRIKAYVEASKQVFAIFEDITPIVEGISIDEAFLDVRGVRRLSGPAPQIAAGLKARVLGEVGLPISVGIARTKFLAKVASAVCKPDGLLRVDPGRELEFLHALPVRRLWGVGEATERKLRDRGILRVEDVAALEPRVLCAMVGQAMGLQLYRLSHNLDARRVRTQRNRRSVGAQRAVGRGLVSISEIDGVVLELIDRITRRLRAAGLLGRTVNLSIRFRDFDKISRARSLYSATASASLLTRVARELVAGERDSILDRGVTLIGFSVSNLCDSGAEQLVLSLGSSRPAVETSRLDAAIDEVRDRWGKGAIDRALNLGRKSGYEAPTLDHLGY